jgi:hypothetical protein
MFNAVSSSLVNFPGKCAEPCTTYFALQILLNHGSYHLLNNQQLSVSVSAQASDNFILSTLLKLSTFS